MNEMTIKSGADILKEEQVTERLNVRAIGLAQKFDRLVDNLN